MQTNVSKQLAKHLQQVYFGGNWTTVNYQQVLQDVLWQEAITVTHDLNSMATLVQHTSYYVQALIDVLQGEPLTSKDELSFAHTPINNNNDWNEFKAGVFSKVHVAVSLLEQFPEEQLLAWFTDEKYGTYHRNILGIIEHLHYHLGQIVIIKKLIKA